MADRVLGSDVLEVGGYRAARVVASGVGGSGSGVTLWAGTKSADGKVPPRGAEDTLIWACRPDPALVGVRAADAAVRGFLASAVAQRKLSQQTDGRIQPVQDLGVDAHGAWRAGPRVMLRASDLMDGKVRPTGAALKALIGGVLEAVAALEAVGRGHGRITAGRVLIEPAGGGARWRVVLDDPAADTDLTSAEPDLRQVGRLLYEMIVLEAYRPTVGYPIEESTGYRRLGKHAGAWLSLTNALMDPALSLEPGKLNAAGALAQLAKISTKESRGNAAGVWLAVAAALLLAGGGVGAWYVTRPQAPAEVVVLADVKLDDLQKWSEHADAWLLQFVQTGLPRVRARLNQDETLRSGVVQRLESIGAARLDPVAVSGAPVRSATQVADYLRSANSPLLQDREFGGRIQTAFVLVGEVVGAIKGWERVVRFEELSGAWVDRGWGAGGQRLRELAGPFEREVFEAGVGERLVAVLDAADRVEAIEARYATLGERAGVVVAAGAETAFEDPADPLLTGYADYVASALRLDGGATGVGPLEAVEARLTEVEELTGVLVAFAGEGWRRVERELFDEESTVLAEVRGGAGPTAGLYRRWVQEAQSEQFRALDPADDPRNGWGGVAELQRLRDEIASLRTDYPGRAEEALAGKRFDERIETLDSAAQGLVALPWKRRLKETVEAGFAETSRGVRALAQEVDEVVAQVRVKWEELRPALAARTGVSDAGLASIDAAYRGRRDELISANAPTEDARSLRDQHEALVGFFDDLERALSVSPNWDERPEGFNQARFEAALRARLDAAAAAALQSAGWGGTAYASNDAYRREVTRQAGALNEWLGRVSRMAADYAAIERLLAGAYLPDEAGPGGRTLAERALGWRGGELLADADVRAALGTVVDRSEAVLQAWESVNVTELVGLAGRLDVPAVLAVTAYARLSDASGGTWPSGVPAIEADLGAQARAAQAIESLGDPARRTAVEARVRAIGAVRLESGLSGLATPDEMDAGLTAARASGVDFSEMPGWVRFNEALGRLRGVEDIGGEEEAVRALAGRYAAELASLEAELGADAGGAWVAELDALSRPPEDEGPALDPAAVGPGRAGWRADADEDLQRLRYTGPDGPGGEITLEFVAVEMMGSDGEPRLVYFCTTEVSLRVFNAIVLAQDRGWDRLVGPDGRSWGEFFEAREAARLNQSAPWLGARVWAWDEAEGRLVPNPTWLSPTPDMVAEFPAYAQEIGGSDPTQVSDAQGRPSLDHPMNYVSPDAAAMAAEWLGCRLPTSAEWAAAFQRYETGTDASDWNLRDRTVMTQRSHVQGLNSAGRTSLVPVPEEGSFVLVRSLLDASQPGWASDDGRLWFDRVGPDAGLNGAARGRTLYGLVGNVGELGSDDGRLQLLGGSAFSAAAGTIEAGAEAQSILPRFRRFGFSDFGFRLVFDAEGALRPSVNTELARLLARAPYVLGR